MKYNSEKRIYLVKNVTNSKKFFKFNEFLEQNTILHQEYHTKSSSYEEYILCYFEKYVLKPHVSSKKKW